MISADAINRLNELGLTAEQYKAALAILVAEDRVRGQSMDKERTRLELQRQKKKNYRENKARVQGLSKDNSGTVHWTEKRGHSFLLVSSSLEDSLKVVKEERLEIVAPADRGDFVVFWAAYPNRVGKADAAKSFERVMKSRRVTFEALMDGLGRYVTKTDDRPWCNPATWLNQGRWDDQPATVQKVQTNREKTSAVIRQLTEYRDSTADDAGDRSEDVRSLIGLVSQRKSF